jgi:hypothetical protein
MRPLNSDGLIASAVAEMPESIRLTAVEEYRQWLADLEFATRPGALPLDQQMELVDLAALIQAEADERSAGGDPTAPLWSAAAEARRLKDATAELEDQFTEETN